MFSSAFFWAINRSQDATLRYDYSSGLGKGYGLQDPYIGAPGSFGSVDGSVLTGKSGTPWRPHYIEGVQRGGRRRAAIAAATDAARHDELHEQPFHTTGHANQPVQLHPQRAVCQCQPSRLIWPHAD